MDNIRVQGWRVRLCQLFWDQDVLSAYAAGTEETPVLSLADLANIWLSLLDQAKPDIAERLQHLCFEMQGEGIRFAAIADSLNQLLLEQAAKLPLRVHLYGMTDTGSQHEHNEDTCYPLGATTGLESDGVFPHLAVICDGIGGHEGGEVASQMAVHSLKLQIQAMLTEVAQQEELLPQEVIQEQLEAVVRVINDLIASQNDGQGREARRRMGTTLVMALQLPQPVTLAQGTVAENSHELYLVNIGDSRAYWVTPRSCDCLTVDDDVAVREVRMGRMLYKEASLRPDAGALVQALGTRDSEFLRPTIQRFLIEEDGVLLLCSDGLSDNGWIEHSWVDVMNGVFTGKRSLANAARAWVELANQKNGHDNISVVLMQFHVSTPLPEVFLPQMGQEPASEWSESSRELLQEADAAVQAQQSSDAAAVKPRSPIVWLLISLAGILLLGLVGWSIWAKNHPGSHQPPQENVKPKP
jgi:protein phosphatase